MNKLPSIGKKTAMRLVLHLLNQDKTAIQQFAQALLDLKEKINYCRICHNISDDSVCGICKDTHRDKTTLCIVEHIRDVIALEKTERYRGLYHILGGLIAPLDHIGPEQLHIASLLERLATQDFKEIIFALSANLHGDTTIYYIRKKLTPLNKDIKISIVSRGIAFGGELEYADEMSLGHALEKRIPVHNYYDS